jgi:hypothetical protein
MFAAAAIAEAFCGAEFSDTQAGAALVSCARCLAFHAAIDFSFCRR